MINEALNASGENNSVIKKSYITNLFHMASWSFRSVLFFLLFLLCNKSFAANHFYFQQKPIDSIPNKGLEKISIVIKDREDGAMLDSVYVVVGLQKGFTDNKGYIEFKNVGPEYNVVVSKAGYYTQAKKAKAVLGFQLIR